MRHLTANQALTALRRGAEIEQMLSDDLATGSFRWLRAHRTDEGFALRLVETLDEGSEDFFDLYEFNSVDASDEHNAGEVIGRSSSPSDLMRLAAGVGASDDRWVNAGLIQDEYLDLIRASAADPMLRRSNWTDGYQFPESFVDLRADPDQSGPLYRELLAELGATHPLHGRPLRVIARSVSNDDIVIESERRIALVHLTWSGAPEPSPWPYTEWLLRPADFERHAEDV